MRTYHLSVESVGAQVSGGWVGPDGHRRRMPGSAAIPGSVDLRLDDGRVLSGIPEEGLRAGDRIYHVLYQGHHVKGHCGLDLINATTGTRLIAASRASAARTWAFHAMAAVPAVLLCLMIGLRMGGMSSRLLDVSMMAMAPGLVFPLCMGIYHDHRRRRLDARTAKAIAACRDEVRRVIGTDVASWKKVLVDTPPAVGARRAVNVRGTAYLLLEGSVLRSRAGCVFIAPGHATQLTEAVVAACGLVHGSMTHVLMSADGDDARPAAVANPLSARTWMDPEIFGGFSGRPYRKTVRAALGRAAWRAVARESDELSRRREKVRLRA